MILLIIIFYLRNYIQQTPHLSHYLNLELRSQSVYVNGEYSNEGIVCCGIPQGSILGPLLFSIFINDLPLHITSNKAGCDMFAVDTSLNASDKDTDTVQNELQRSINEAYDWCDSNAMILHPAKTKSMLLTTRQKHQLRPLHLNLSLEDSYIEQVHAHRHFGVITDEEFSWQPHIIGTCKTVSKNLYLLSQLRHFVDTLKCRLFYHAHISSHLTYASTVWDGCSDILFNKLNSLHRRAAKLMISDSSLSTNTKLWYLGILPLKEELMFYKAVLEFKACKNLAPPYLKQLFICSNICATSRYITLPKPRIDLFKTSFPFSGTSLWNTIPKQIKSCNSLTSFKTELYKWIRSRLL